MKRKAALMDNMLWPGGKSRAFTMSYDDGTIHDRRLVEIVNRHGLKCTFNLNSGFFGLERTGFGDLDISVIPEEEAATLYEGQEVAGHGLYHAGPGSIGMPAFLYETIEDKAQLEKIIGKLVRGYAYPFGMFNAEVKEALKMAGYHYGRVVDTTGRFDIPEDFLEWRGTAHHNDKNLMELAENFVKNDRFSRGKKLFYLWGHSYEFEGDKTWDVIENICAFMEEHGEDIWFATNSEICDYVTAFRSLEYSADASMVYNPTGQTLYLKRGFGGELFVIAPLQTVVLD